MLSAIRGYRVVMVLLMFSMLSVLPGLAFAASARQIDVEVDATLERFAREINGGKTFLAMAKGVLVFPSVLKAGFYVGGEYGEGALRVNNRTVDYYNTAGASFGLQIGVQSKSIVVVFLTEAALQSFRKSDGWKAGVDGSIALVEWGMGEDLSTLDVRDPIVGFVFNNQGLMVNLTVEGSKFTKIYR